MTSNNFASNEPSPAEKYDTLGDLGMPVELCSLLPAKSRGLGLISGADDAEIHKMMAALAHSFKAEGRSTVFLRMADGFTLPGIPEISASSRDFEKMILERGLNHVLLLDSIDTKEKLTFAINASMGGRTVIAPVTSYDAESAVDCLINLGVNRFLLADVLRYIAQQTILEDPFSAESTTIVDTFVAPIDIKWKKLIWAYGRK